MKALGSVRGALTATATVITAVLGVVFLLVPSWRPLSRDNIGAFVKVAAVEGGVPLVNWAGRQYPGHGREELTKLLGHPVGAGDEQSSGLVLYVVLRTEGFKHRSIKLRTRVYDAKTKRPAEGVAVRTLLPKAGRLKIDAPSRASVQLLLLDDLTLLEGTFFVRVEAYDDDGILAYDDSPKIHGT